MMNRVAALKIVNPVLALLLLNQAASGMLHDVLPHEAFEVLHAGGYLLVVVAVVHLWLNWNWVKAQLLPGSKGQSTGQA